MKHIIGVDAGGTKTTLALYKLDGTKVDSISIASCHYMQVEYKDIEAMIREAVEQLIEKHLLDRTKVHISFGMAGYGQSRDVQQRLEHTLDQALNEISYSIYSDVQSAMYGALGGHDGIVIVAGTGSIALSVKNGVEKRCGGWGFSIGDEGSAYWLAKNMLAQFAKQADGILEKTSLYFILKQELDLKEDYDIIDYVNNVLNNKRDKVASLAKYVQLGAQANDAFALQLYDDAAKELSLLINHLGKEFQGTPTKVSYIGGVFRSMEFILKPLANYLDPHLELQAPKYAPEYGAYLLVEKQS